MIRPHSLSRLFADMHMQDIPPITISPLADTAQSWQWLEPDGPVDFSVSLQEVRWSAEIVVQYCGCEIYRAPVELQGMGYLTATIPAHVAQALQWPRRIDATYQITFTSPIPEMSTIWTGGVVVQE